ncbi:MAG: PAS domain S-box protein [Sulfuritalea sp.]|nr:PAS domain S-box protein [Sulfuritalea sp.]
MTDAIDLRTVMLLTTFVAMTTAMAMVFLWRSHPDESSLPVWALGALLVAAGYLGVALREWISPFVSIPLANACITTGHACFLVGVDRLTGRKPPPWPAIVALGLAIMGLLSYFTFVQSSTAIRMAIQFVAIGLLSVMTARRLLAAGDSGHGVPHRSVAVLFLGYGLVLLIRVGVMPFDAPGQNLFAPSPIHQAVFVVMLLFHAALMYGFPALLFAKEIRQRQQSEANLRDSRDDFQNTLATTLDGFWNVSAQGRLIDVNERYAEQSGYPREELLGMSIPDLEAQESAEVTASHIQRIIETGHDQFETVHRRKDGSLWHVEINTIYLPEKGGKFFVFLRDISERKNALAALHASEASKAAILNSVAATIAVVNRNGIIREVNDPWRRFALENGVEPGKPAAHTEVGANYLAACKAGHGLPADNALEACAGIEAVLDRRLPVFRLEYPCHSPNHERWFIMMVVPLGQNPDDGVVITHTDITEVRRSEARLALAREQRDTLVREVHHRIKNNLQSVAGLLQRELGRFLELDPRLETAISQVHAIAIVHGLQSAHPDEAVRLCDSIRSICKTVSDLSQRPVLFHVEDEHTAFRSVRIENSEAVSISLMINELVLNAIKHSPHGSTPTVSLSADGGSARLVIRNALTTAPEFKIDTGEGLGTGLRLVLSLLPENGAHLTYELDTESFMLTRLELTAPVISATLAQEPG